MARLMSHSFTANTPFSKTIAILIALLFGMALATQCVGSQFVDENAPASSSVAGQSITGTPVAKNSVVGKLVSHLNSVEPNPTPTEPNALAPQVPFDVLPLNTNTESFGQTVDTKTAFGGNQEVFLDSRDEIWLINARQSHITGPVLENLCVTRAEGSEWVDSSLAELALAHNTDKSLVTVVYAHGNRTDLCWAEARGLQFYRAAFQSPGATRRPIRYVMFCWKSESERPRLYPDFRIKSQRSVVVGDTYGKLLGIFNDRNLILAGFSLGAQVVMQGLADNELHGKPLTGKYQVAIFAPAIDPSFVCSGLRRFAMNPMVEQTKVFLNQRDRAVKAARAIASRGNNCVASLRELAAQNCMNANQIGIVDITTQVSKSHSIVKYAASQRLRCELNRMVNHVFESANTIQNTQPEFEMRSVIELGN